MLENIVPLKSKYGTPPEISEAVRLLMGEIDLDPATSHTFNDFSVKAVKIYTEDDNGLEYDWHGRVYLNPPGGKAKPRASAWWQHLVEQYVLGNTTQACYMSFALDSFQWSQKGAGISVLEYPTIAFAKRIAFYDDHLDEAKSPNRPCAIHWLPPTELEAAEVRSKFSEFSENLDALGFSGVRVYGEGWL